MKRPSVFVLTGAGISAESGIRTFRDANGLWEGYRPEQVATPEAFEHDPELVHRFYNERRRLLLSGEVQPNPAHFALVALEEALGDSFYLVTQNVDDLHERAGSKRLLHMHGELTKKRCAKCGVVSDCREDLDTSMVCDSCGKSGGLRPHIVWFGEMPFGLDELWENAASCDLFIAIGTSGVVEPAASLVSEARRHGADTVCFSLEAPENRGLFEAFVQGKAGETLPSWIETYMANR